MILILMVVSMLLTFLVMNMEELKVTIRKMMTLMKTVRSMTTVKMMRMIQNIIFAHQRVLLTISRVGWHYLLLIICAYNTSFC